jgi:hypothetical protein
MDLENKSEYVNHYSLHIMDPAWGHLVVKMSGHPPFGAQVILNGHEYVACHRPGRVHRRRPAARVSAMPGHDGYTIRNAAYDLRKLRGKHLADKPGAFAVNATWLPIAAMAHNLVRRRRAGQPGPPLRHWGFGGTVFQRCNSRDGGDTR